MEEILKSLNLNSQNNGAWGAEEIPASSERNLTVHSPIDGKELGSVLCASNADYDVIVEQARKTFYEWRQLPAPRRGQIIREIGNQLRSKKQALGKLVTLEVGKVLAEGEGEIQEAIDIADFAVGLSRQLYGKTMHSERPAHRMYEQWHPLGVVGVITAFNFPAAVWAWNSMIAAVCGDVVVWKPSEKAPLTALAINKICRDVAASHGFPGLFSLVISDGPELGQRMAADQRLPLISATGSCRMGRSVGETVAKRLGRSLLELGGNNAMIILKDADLKLAVPSIVFGAVGTAGQRCTTTRRLIVEKGIEKELLSSLASAYKQLRIGNPLEQGVLVGPLIDKAAVLMYTNALDEIKKQGGEIVCGGEIVKGMPSDLYVKPTIVKAKKSMPIVKEEIFAPILYVITVEGLDEAIEVHNSVPQGLSSSIFTTSLQSAERFLSATGSDCGIANVNIGTSGAEIGGAFGGEKDTGGGRESGSDSWRQYMRRQTNTINWSNALPLAQGIKFDYSSS
ncbi:MAG: aldehyde dehydrogenase family protein [Deltaproteobacteria bacterium]|nr:aldehyde dehydrogenase family protein [Deltaproteobacteria bacterium]